MRYFCKKRLHVQAILAILNSETFWYILNGSLSGDQSSRSEYSCECGTGTRICSWYFVHYFFSSSSFFSLFFLSCFFFSLLLLFAPTFALANTNSFKHCKIARFSYPYMFGILHWHWHRHRQRRHQSH